MITLSPTENTGLKLYKDSPLEDLKLPLRLEKALMSKNIVTVGKFLRCKRRRLLKMKNIGPKSARYLMRMKHQISLLSTAETSYDALKHEQIEVLELDERLKNSLEKGGIGTLWDLYKASRQQLLRKKGIGPKAINLLMEVKQKLRPFPPFLAGSDQMRHVSNKRLIENLLERLSDSRKLEVIRRRYGLKTGEKETLEEIGKNYGITRERVRQIQKRALKDLMRYPSSQTKQPITKLVEEILWKNKGIISSEEADRLIPETFRGLSYDGSSLLDLLADLGWIQKYVIDYGENLYAPKIESLSLQNALEKIINVLKNSETLLSASNILSKLPSIKEIRNEKFKPLLFSFIERYCRLDPRIEEKIRGKYTHYSKHSSTKTWTSLICQILKEANMPLHYTEITNKVNNLFASDGQQLDPRRAHAILIGQPIFAHTGIRGMYGLTNWGLRKESTVELVAEFIRNAGFPVHWEQIYNYVSKYKDSPKLNIRSVLDLNGKFKRKGNGFYDLKQR